MSNGRMRIDRYDSDHTKLREELRKIRVGAGLSQEQLAELLGTKQTFVSKYERGERNLDFIEVLRVCVACKVEPENLIVRLGLALRKRTVRT